MKILHIYKDYYPVVGGIENHVRVLAEAQSSSGHHTTVLATNPNFRTVAGSMNGVHVILAGRVSTIASMPISIALPWILTRLHPDLVHIHSPFPLGEVSAWIFRRTIPTVITYHSDVVRQKGWLALYGPLLRRILRRADSVVVSSPRYVETSTWLRPVRDKCMVIPFGVDDQRFSPPAETFHGPPTLLFVGKLRYYKGLDTLLSAMVSLPDVWLNIIGDGPQRKRLERMTIDLRLTERVRFMGDVDHLTLPQYYRKAHVFVLPSNARAEAFGTVLLEAMASGLPCVTTELGTGTSWVVQDGIQGVIVPPRDPGALAEAIRSLMKDEGLRTRMGQAGRERVMALFRQPLMIRRIEELYQSLLDTFDGARPRFLDRGEKRRHSTCSWP